LKTDKAVLALNGELSGKSGDYDYLKKREQKKPFYIAADGGALLLEKIGIRPDLIVGDLDSLSSDKLKEFRKSGINIKKHPRNKDKTDGELALDYCIKIEINFVQIIGLMGGRFDQQLGNISLLEYAAYKNIKAVIEEPHIKVGIVKDEIAIKQQVGKVFSLIPRSEIVSGVSIRGCKYNVENEEFYRYLSRGISNKILSSRASVSLKEGSMIYIISDPGSFNSDNNVK